VLAINENDIELSGHYLARQIMVASPVRNIPAPSYIVSIIKLGINPIKMHTVIADGLPCSLYIVSVAIVATIDTQIHRYE